MNRSHRRRPKPKPLTQAQRALADWLTRQMADPVAAAQAFIVIGLHAGLVLEIHEAELNAVQLAVPQRRHLGDPRDANRQTGRHGDRDPDDAMVAIVDARLFGHGLDPEHLGPTRHYLTNELGKLAGWYVAQTGMDRQSAENPVALIYWQRWEFLAVRFGDLTGDQVAANALATSVLGHHHLAITALTPSRGVCHAARQRWTRMAERYVRTLDEQPERGPRTVQSVEGEGERERVAEGEEEWRYG